MEPYVNHSLTWQTIDVHIYLLKYCKTKEPCWNIMSSGTYRWSHGQILIGLINYSCMESRVKEGVDGVT